MSIDRINWYTVRNTESESVPPFGVMLIAGSDTDGTLTITRPSADSQTQGILFNGAFGIPAGQKGQGYQATVMAGAYDTADGAPAVGNSYGTLASDWRLRKSNTGFTTVSTGDSGAVLVVQSQGDYVQRYTLSADTNDLSLDARASTLLIDATGNYKITGLAGGADGRRLTIMNVNTGIVTLSYFDSGSSSGNKFAWGSSADITLGGHNSIDIVYDGLFNHYWRDERGVYASDTQAGWVSTDNQTFSGVKTFLNNVIIPLTGSVFFSNNAGGYPLVGLSGYSQYAILAVTEADAHQIQMTLYTQHSVLGGMVLMLSGYDPEDTSQNPSYGIFNYATSTGYKGIWDTLTDGSEVKGGIITSKGAGAIAALTVNTTTISGGTANSLLYSDGSKLQSASNTRISSNSLEVKLASDRWLGFTKRSY